MARQDDKGVPPVHLRASRHGWVIARENQALDGQILSIVGSAISDKGVEVDERLDEVLYGLVDALVWGWAEFTWGHWESVDAETSDWSGVRSCNRRRLENSRLT